MPAIDCADSAAAKTDQIAPDLEVLHDRDGSVARLFGLLYEVTAPLVEALRGCGVEPVILHDGDQVGLLVVPVTYVVGQDGVVAYACTEVHSESSAAPSNVIAMLERLAKADRPDV